MSEDNNNTQNIIPDVLPLEVIDKTLNNKVWILLQTNREFTGTLVGVDDFVNVILEDSVEYIDTLNNDGEEGIVRHHGRMLLSGNNIAMIVPGDKTN